MWIKLVGWIGATVITVAPFLMGLDIGKQLAILGLTLISVQAFHLKAYNIVIANVIGAIGYAYVLLC
jgi:hypothetical protein